MSSVEKCVLCRSRRELSNEAFIAKFGIDTAENEHSKKFGLPSFPGIPPWGNVNGQGNLLLRQLALQLLIALRLALLHNLRLFSAGVLIFEKRPRRCICVCDFEWDLN